jgi:hypothetical protein
MDPFRDLHRHAQAVAAAAQSRRQIGCTVFPARKGGMTIVGSQSGDYLRRLLKATAVTLQARLLI